MSETIEVSSSTQLEQDRAWMVAWSEKVTQALGLYVLSALNVGRVLAEAKEDASRPELWVEFVAGLPIPKETVEKYVKVAQDPFYQELGEELAAKLPASVWVMVELAKIPADKRRQALESGVINPSITVPAARRLVHELDPTYQPPVPRERTPEEDAVQTERESKAARAALLASFSRLPEEMREEAVQAIFEQLPVEAQMRIAQPVVGRLFGQPQAA